MRRDDLLGRSLTDLGDLLAQLDRPGRTAIPQLQAAQGLKPGQVPSQADIAKMRAQAMDMAKAMKAQQGADK